MNGRRWWLAVTAALAPLLLALVWVEAQRSQAEQGTASGGDTELPSMVLQHHLERFRRRDGAVSWQFLADRVEILSSGDYLVHGLEKGQYFSNGEMEVEFSADRGRLDARTQNVVAGGNVDVASPRGIRFTADRVYWYESTSRMIVPRVKSLEWRDPKHPEQPPATVETGRVFYWAEEQRIELPDKLVARHEQNLIEAASAIGWLDQARLQLAGPARLGVLAALEPGATGKKRLLLTVGPGGAIAYNSRAGSAAVKRDVQVQIPADGVMIRCDQALYSGEPDRRVTASGNLSLTDPANHLTAPRAVVATKAQTAEFSGPVHLEHRGGERPLTIDASSMSYRYAAGGRRATARGPVRLRTAEADGTASRAEVDLEAEVAVLTGSVRLNHRPSGAAPAGANEFERQKYLPVRVTCRRLVHTFRAGARQSVATGSPHFHQGDWQGTADRITFDHEREVLVLDGGVKLWNDEGERAAGGRVTYDAARQSMRIERPEGAEFYLREEP